MKLQLFQVDAFTGEVFKGNPACVVPLREWLKDEILLKIAQENAVAETAFFIDKGDHFHLRWFTPEIEMDLCGHATLATAHVIISELNYNRKEVIFESESGILVVTEAQGIYTMDFPSRPPLSAELPYNIRQSLNIPPQAVFKARDYVLLYERQEEVENIEIDRVLFDQLNLDPGGVIVTAKGEKVDFVSRFFTPQASILEDPVTGSAHCSLIPFWSERLKKTQMTAHQVSDRGGTLYCDLKDNRVLISGNAKTYLRGTIDI